MQFLITGASGFLGSVCLRALLSQPELNVSVLRSGHQNGSLHSSANTITAPESLQASDLDKLLSPHHPTHIIHIGAFSSPEACEREPALAHTSNVVFTEMLAEYASMAGARLTTVSTDLVFDGSAALPGGFSESAIPTPLSVYSRSKYKAEQATLNCAKGAVVRLSLMYGHSPSNSKGVLGWMKHAFTQRASLMLFDDEFRTPIHVRDAARALCTISQRELTGVWHCGGPQRLSRVAFGIHVAEALGYEASLIRPTSRRAHMAMPERPEDVSLDSRKLWSELGFSAQTVRAALQIWGSDCGETTSSTAPLYT